jgi:hypothetical protein
VPSTLAERRRINDFPRIEAMLHNADLIFSVRTGGFFVIRHEPSPIFPTVANSRNSPSISPTSAAVSEGN